jgi:hypothetical protein
MYRAAGEENGSCRGDPYGKALASGEEARATAGYSYWVAAEQRASIRQPRVRSLSLYM